jgi:hypothetical protein
VDESKSMKSTVGPNFRDTGDGPAVKARNPTVDHGSGKAPEDLTLGAGGAGSRVRAARDQALRRTY